MLKPLLRNIVMAALALGVPALAAIAHPAHAASRPGDTGYLAVEHGVKLRRIVFQNPRAKTRTLLQGFPGLGHATEVRTARL